MKIIVDTDPGVDDLLALGIAFTWPSVEILAVTCVSGNTTIDKVCINALKLQKVFGREDVPIHKGAAKPLIEHNLSEVRTANFFGEDGLKDCTDHITVDMSNLADKHAAQHIIDLAQEHKGEISLVALGPLTNLALAVRLCPELPSLLKDVYILGGNYTGLGNVTTTSEFNFAADPVAAHVVLQEYSCPMYVVPWETIVNTDYSENFAKKYCSDENDRSNFFRHILEKYIPNSILTPYDSADCLAMCVALHKDDVIAEQMHVHATVEPFGAYTGGMMIVDRRREAKTPPNISLITKVNTSKIEEMLIHSVS